MKTIIFGAGSDLGVHIDGAHLGPTQLLNDLKSFFKGEMISLVQDEAILKSRNLSDRRKNEYDIDKFNTKLYQTILEKNTEEFFPIVVGGDHSVSVASSLASSKIKENLGIIWISSHADYNTFETTVTGNIHGLSLAAINGTKCEELRYFHDGNVIQAAKTVVVGARKIDDWEKDDIKYSGITIFTTEDIKTKGVEEVMRQAFEIAGYKTKGIHVCYNLDVLDPDIAPGVSIPEFDGINEEEAMAICSEIVKNINTISSFDLTEFNPLRDKDRKTEQIAINILAKMIRAGEEKRDKLYVERKF